MHPDNQKVVKKLVAEVKSIHPDTPVVLIQGKSILWACPS